MKFIKYVFVSLTLLVSCSGEGMGSFQVINNSGKDIFHLSINICDQSFEFSDLKAGRALSRDFKINCEGGFKVVTKFYDGKIIKGEVGYVTVGIDTAQKISISAEELSLVE